MINKVLYDDGSHKCIVLARDPERPSEVIDTNEYIILSNNEALLIDPGGTEIFPTVLRDVAKVLNLSQIKVFFASHQDPDVFSSLPLWLGLCPHTKLYLPWLWKGFLAHFGYEFINQFVAIPDEGGTLTIGSKGRDVLMVPAHFCHSSGNYSVYDPTSKILFSGDIGAALIPADHGVFVEDFTAHIEAMQFFHQRWMPSTKHKNNWIERVRKLDVKMIAPQHGAIFRDQQVGQFLDWLESIEVGKHAAL